MLVLSQRLGESVYLTVNVPGGEPLQVRVTLLDIDRGKVRLGYQAPNEVLVSREKLLGHQQCREIEERTARQRERS